MSNIKSTRAKQGEGDVLEEDGGQAHGEDGLTPKQRNFVQAFVRGSAAGNISKASVVAGYSQKTAPQIGHNLMKLPRIISAIEAVMREEIGLALTAESIGFLATTLRDVTAPLKIRTAIALKITEGSGVLERTRIEKGKQTGLEANQSLTGMTRDDLERLVRQGADLLKAAAALPPAGPVLEGRLLGDGAQDRAQPDEPETE